MGTTVLGAELLRGCFWVIILNLVQIKCSISFLDLLIHFSLTEGVPRELRTKSVLAKQEGRRAGGGGGGGGGGGATVLEALTNWLQPTRSKVAEEPPSRDPLPQGTVIVLR